METFKCPLINKSPTLDDDGDRQICLNCPLPECIEFSRTKGARLVKVKKPAEIKAERNARIIEYKKQGKLTRWIARKEGLSMSVVQKVIRKSAKLQAKLDTYDIIE